MATTHEELDAAAEEVENEEEQVAEEQESEEKPEKPEKKEEAISPFEDERVKSALGRISGFQSRMDSLENMIKKLLEKQSNDDFEEDEPVITSKKDVLEVLEESRQREKEAKQTYVQTATNALIDIGMKYTDLDDETYVKIHKDAESNWNAVTNDPKIDAQINFNEALTRYYKGLAKESKKPKNPLEKNKDVEEQALGGGTESEIREKRKKMPKLDAAAEDFVKRTGMKAETVHKALEGDMPAYLGGR